jgi:hypothetical protein
MLYRHLDLEDHCIGSLLADHLEGGVGGVRDPDDDGSCVTGLDHVSHDLTTLGSRVDQDDAEARAARRRGYCHALCHILKAGGGRGWRPLSSTNSDRRGPIPAPYAWPAPNTHCGPLGGFPSGCRVGITLGRDASQ